MNTNSARDASGARDTLTFQQNLVHASGPSLRYLAVHVCMLDAKLLELETRTCLADPYPSRRPSLKVSGCTCAYA